MHKIAFRVPSRLDASLKLDQAIAQFAESDKSIQLTRALVRKLIVAGAVYVNGKRTRVVSREMSANEIVEAYVDSEKLPKTEKIETAGPLRVLYHDDAIICFDKPAGLPTQPTLDEGRANLFDLAKKQFDGYVGMHHRLDKDTSGVILFTRDSKHNTFIANQFKEHLCTKIYVAMVHGKLKNEKGRLESFLGQVGKRGKQAKFGSVRSGGKKAITNFLVLATNGRYSLIEVKIETGRTHQIRVHFSESGHPIVGDTLYGSPPSEYKRHGRFLLHAHALTIEHPVTHNLVRIESPIPPEIRL